MLRLCLIFFSIYSFNFFPQSLNKKLDQYLTDYYINKDVPSVSAGLSYDGKIIWIGTRGFSDIENNVQAADKSVYRIASVSKVITAVAIMQLVEQGKLKLDEDIRKYIPYYPTKKWKFTVRQLLSHTAGIRNYKSTGEFESKEYFQSTKETISYLAKDSLQFEPGTKFLYTTLSYNLLAAVIENVSGIPFPDYLQNNIFLPAGMNSTYPDFQRDIIPFRVKGYERNKYRKIQNAALADLSIKIPGGGLLSSVEDLLKFSDSLLKGKLIKPSSLDSMIIPAKLKDGKSVNYGLGFAINMDKSGKKFMSHSGTGTGFSTLLLIYPEEKLASVHLINIRDRNLGEPAYDIAEIYFGNEVIKPKKSIADFLFNFSYEFGIDSALAIYQIIKKDTVNDFNTSKEELLLFGYDLLGIEKYYEAIKFFRLFTTEYPNYAEAFIGLGEAYYKDGNRGLALKSFRQAAKLQPANRYIINMINKLGE
ncbi:MAG: serine hydrolase [Ignavibacteriales bacterium]|nr:MAG: serine hydrolase [Ignavibacteriales bacterium]